MRMDVAKNRASNNVSFRSGKAIPDDSSRKLKTIQPSGTLVQELALAASDKNQVMDELLNQPDIPSDYGETMVSLYRDRGQDVLTRDFAVQHIGLYAQALNRRGVYDPESATARSLRVALFDAAAETRTIVAAAAFRALADMAAYAEPGRTGGYPHMKRERLTPDNIRTLSYYDAVNFARHITCPVRMTWGYNDDVCTPTTSYAVWNVLDSPKESLITPINEHWTTDDTEWGHMEWILEHLR